jgi:hypothetical protein
MKLIKVTQNGGLASIMSLAEAQEELKEFYENAMPQDQFEYRVVEMSEIEFEKLPEFQGY